MISKLKAIITRIRTKPNRDEMTKQNIIFVVALASCASPVIVIVGLLFLFSGYYSFMESLVILAEIWLLVIMLIAIVHVTIISAFLNGEDMH